MKIKESLGSRVFDTCNVVFMLILIAVMIYPFVYVTAASFSTNAYIMKGEVAFWPKGFTTEAYRIVLSDRWVWIGYYNTILYTVLQTVITVFFTSITAYPLSKRNFLWRRQLLMMIGFTMLFSGGLIPNFLLVKTLELYNTRWALLIPGAINTFHLFIMRTFFENIPQELEEAAIIDGATSWGVFWRVVIPLSTAVFATIALFTAVAQWNAFFGALVYLKDKSLYPLQIYLRNMVIAGSAQLMVQKGDQLEHVEVVENIKYSAIIVATLPILLVYPFLQKYFVKGVMLGSIKG